MEPAAAATAAQKKRPVLHPKYRAKKHRAVTEDTEKAPREGVAHKAVHTCDQNGDELLSSNEEESMPPKRSRFGLRIALQFPSKKCESKDINRPAKMNLRQQKKKMATKRKTSSSEDIMEREPEPEVKKAKSNVESSEALLRRAMNIKENKAVLAQLLAELNSVPDMFPMKTPPSNQKSKKTSRRSFSEGPVERRTNPTRSARPPENFGLENFTQSAMQFAEHFLKNGKKAFRRRTLTEEEREEIRERRRSSKYNNTRPVEEITEEELENVADFVKDKVYDKIKGSTCHQCRQKTLDTKTICRYPGCGGVKGQFCGPCLRNRYGEDVREALLDPEWICPPCRDICNCSYCRKRDGRGATGMLIHLAKFSGYDNVKEYLESLQKRLAEDE